MTRGRGVMVATLMVALVAAATAAAAGTSQRLSGHIQGDGDSIVRLKVATDNDGAPKVVKGFRFKKVNAVCNGEAQRISIKLFGRAPLNEDRTFKRSFGDSTNGVATVEGRVRRDGARVVGSVRAPAVSVVGIGVCKVPAQGFVVSG